MICVTAVLESGLVLVRITVITQVDCNNVSGLLSSQTYDLSRNHSDFAAVCTGKAQSWTKITDISINS